MQNHQQLEKIFAQLSHLEHLSAMAHWDEAVMMPEGGGEARAAALATLHRLSHEKLTDKKIGELLKKAHEERLSSLWQSANLKWMQRFYDHARCLPADLVEALTNQRAICEQVWRQARAKNDWSSFLPHLEKVVELTRQSAQMRSQFFGVAPYDLLIDEFSPGLNSQIIDPIFTRLKSILPGLIEKIIAKQKSIKIIEPQGPFAISQQKELGLALMRAIGFDFNHGRLDVSHHPFCGGVPQDVRITTRYNEQEFVSSAMGTCHETGHARYEQNLPREWISQPVGRIHSMAMHESQSLLIEMQACRSAEFMQFLAPLTKNYFGEQVALSSDNLHHLYTRVQKGLIRVDADEVTYPLHVILRYEIEKELITGAIECRDLPDLWNEKMAQYFNLNTQGDFKNGVMQDVHWPSGAFGYFPAYTLGSLIAAQLFAAAKKANPAVLSELSSGNFVPLYNWLIPNFQSHASSLDFTALMQSATGEALNADYFLKHVEQRYL